MKKVCPPLHTINKPDGTLNLEAAKGLQAILIPVGYYWKVMIMVQGVWYIMSLREAYRDGFINRKES